jgi:hypothetical protein
VTYSLSNIEDQIKQLREDLKLAQQEATGRTVQDVSFDTTKDSSVLKENQLLFASVSEQLNLLATLNQSKK